MPANYSLITTAIAGHFGRSPIPQITHDPQLASQISYVLRACQPAAALGEIGRGPPRYGRRRTTADGRSPPSLERRPRLKLGDPDEIAV